MTDFSMLSGLCLYSDRCGLKEFQKFEDSIRRGNLRVKVTDFMKVTDPNQKGGE